MLTESSTLDKERTSITEDMADWDSDDVLDEDEFRPTSTQPSGLSSTSRAFSPSVITRALNLHQALSNSGEYLTLGAKSKFSGDSLIATVS
jgi:hypothetical protein